MVNTGVFLPSSGGGLMRYNEEYKSRFMIRPAHVIVFIVLIIIFVYALKIIYPIN